MAPKRRYLRWTLEGLAALVIVAIGSALVAVRTDAGRSFAARRVEQALNGVLHGRVAIGRLEGNLLGRIVATDLVVLDSDGTEAIRIARLEASYRPWSLARQVVHLEDVKVVDPIVIARRDPTGALNLAKILPSPGKGSGGPPWRVEIGGAAVTGGRFSLDDTHLDGIALAGAMDQEGPHFSVRLDEARAHWVEKGLAVEARGALDGEGEALKLDGLEVHAGGSRLAVARAAGRTDLSQIRAEVDLEVQPSDVLRFAPDLPLRGEVTASGLLSRAGDGEPLRASLKGALAGAPWSLEARVAPAPLRAAGSLQLEGVDPAAVWAGAPAGRVKAALEVDLAGASLDALRGTARLEASGELGGNAVERAAADLTISDGVLRGRVTGRAPGARVDVEGALSVAPGPVAVRAARIRAQVPQLGRFVGQLPLRGDLSVDLTADGPLDDLAVSGSAAGTSFRYQDLHATRVVLEADVKGLPRDAVGRARLDASGVQQGTAPVGEVHADGAFHDHGRRIDLTLRAGAPGLPYGASARARVDRAAGEPTVIRIAELSIKTRQLTWSGTAGRVVLEPGGGVVATDLSLASPAGRLSASGRLRASCDRLELDLRGARLEEIRRALAPDGPDVRGTASAHLVVAERERRVRRAEATVAARGLVLGPGADPLSLDLEASLDGRDLKARVAAEGGRSGAIKLDLDASAPADPFDVAAWSRIDERDVHRLHLELAALDLRRLLEPLHLARPPVGVVDADLDAVSGLSRVDARMVASEVVVPSLDRPLSAQMTLALAARRLRVQGYVRREGGGEIALDAQVATPEHLTRLEAWRRLDLADVESGRVTFEGVELAWIGPLRARFPDIEGRLSGALVRAGGGGAVDGDIRLEGGRAAPLIVPVSARLRTTLEDRRLQVDLASSLGDHPLLRLQGAIAAGLDAIRRGAPDAFLASSGNAKVQVEALPLELVRKAMDLPVQASGSLRASAELSGSVGQPRGELTAALEGGAIGDVHFAALDAAARLEARRITGRVSAAQEGAGSLQADVRVDLDDARAGAITVKARRFDLRFLALFASERGLQVSRGLLDADISIDGTPGQPRARGTAEASGADLRLTEVMGTFHEADLKARLDPGGALALGLDTRVGAEGRLKVDATAQLAGLGLRDVKGTFESRALSVSTGRSKADVDARGSFTGEPQADLYRLTARVDDGTVTLPKMAGGALHPTGVPEDVIFVDARGRREEVAAAGTPFLEVRLRTARPVLVKSEELRAELDLSLDATLSARRAVLRGQIRIETGFAELFGRRWTFQGSTVAFDGSDPPNPRLDLKLDYEFRATTVAIAVGGTLQKPELALSAGSGGYDPSQLLGFVLGGSPDDPGPATGRDVSGKAVDAGVGLAFGQLQPLLKRVVPVDLVSLQNKSGATQSTLFTVGKWLSSDLFLAYQQRFGNQTDLQQNTYEGQLQWYFARGLRLDLVFGDRGEGSADALWIRRW